MDTDTTTTTPEETPTTTDRMRRPLEGRMLAGVAAAFAQRMDVDVSLMRIGFVVASLFGGFGIVAYLASWALLPDEGQDRSPAERWLGKQ